MSSAASQPNLRLVSADDAADSQWRAQGQARLSVVKENRLSATSGLDPTDPRWILAMQARTRLQGSTLTPERREQLLKTGHKLGLRSFESSLVIAIVQDQARSGNSLQLSQTHFRLMSDSPTSTEQVAAPRPTIKWPRWFAAIAGGLAVAAVLMRWITT
jgi:hypothetical protein